MHTSCTSVMKRTLTIDWGQGGIDQPRPTIPVFTPSELASTNEKARLFAALEKFVNLGDTIEIYGRFLAQWPMFLPASIKYIVSEDNPEALFVDWATPACHRIALVYRNVLRRLWVKDQQALDSGLGSFLLGFDNALGTDLNPAIPGLDEAWREFKTSYRWWQIERPDLYVHWRLGAFLYNPITDFQRAVYILFRESWRAKVCPCCSRFLVAQKPAQTYCSNRCYGVAKQSRGLDWWRQHGEGWRRARLKASRKSRRISRRKRAKHT